jgi:hypothetical protein
MEYDCRNEIYDRRINFVEIASAKLGNPAERGNVMKNTIITEINFAICFNEISNMQK